MPTAAAATRHCHGRSPTLRSLRPAQRNQRSDMISSTCLFSTESPRISLPSGPMRPWRSTPSKAAAPIRTMTSGSPLVVLIERAVRQQHAFVLADRADLAVRPVEGHLALEHDKGVVLVRVRMQSVLAIR